MLLHEIDRLLTAHAPRWRPQVAGVVAVAVLKAAVVVLRPLPIKGLVDGQPAEAWAADLVQVTGLSWLWLCLVAVLVIELTCTSLTLVVEFRLSALVERVGRSVRGTIIRRLLRGPYKDVSQVSAGAMIASASSDLDTIIGLLREGLIAGAVSSLQLVLVLIVIIFTDVSLFTLIVVQIVVLGSWIAIYSSMRKVRFLRKMGIEARFLSLLASLQQRLLDVRFSTLRAVFVGRAGNELRQLFGVNLSLWRRHGTHHALIDFVTGISTVLCLLVLLAGAGGEAVQPGKFVLFLYYTMLIYPNLAQIGETWPRIIDSRAALSRLGPASGLGSHDPRAFVPADTVGFGTIEFDNVDLVSDQGQVLLDKVSFKIEPGERFCIAGESGTGKSTILSLLLGLQQPTGGRVTIDGVEIGKLPLATRKRFFLFARAATPFVPGRLLENIVLHRELDDAALQRILSRARLDRRLTPAAVRHEATIGEKGEPFSAGEQQRIGAARWFHADQPCLILDEALNSLDEAGELGVTRALMEDWVGTMIVISHRRTATLMFPRRIELLGGGRWQLVTHKPE